MSRVLHIGKFYPPFAGGVENFMADLLPAQRALGEEAHVLAHDHDKPGWPPWTALRPDPSYPWVYRAPCHGRLLYAPVSPLFPVWLTRLLKRLRPELLHLHLPNTSAFWALFLPAARKLPWVIHWHADVVASALDTRLILAYRLYRPWEQALLKRAARVLVTSPPYLESSEPLRPWREKCRVVPLGLDAERLPSSEVATRCRVEQIWPRGRDGLRVLCLGRLTYYKGHEYLLKALAQTPEAQAVLVGSGELRARLARAIAEHQLEDRVYLAGFRPNEEVNALFETCDLLCLPSLERTEAFGVVLLEAMRYARPVLATAVTGAGMNWVVRHGQTGLLVPPADSDALAAALRRLAANRQWAAELGRAGRQRLVGEFDIRAVAGQIAEIYQEVLTP